MSLTLYLNHKKGDFIMFKTRSLLFAALCIALGIVLPMAFHGIPQGGRIFSPMHIPVLLAGLLTGPVYGLIVGVMTPVLSSILTSMPPAPILPSMTVELAVYGLGTGLFMQILPIRRIAGRVYGALLISMLLGRVVAGLANALIFQFGAYSIQAFISAYFVTSFPGIVVHIVTVPLVYFALHKAGISSPAAHDS